MKMNLIAVAILLSSIGIANAQTTVEVPLNGTLAKTCNISAFLNGPFDALDMSSTAVQGAESLTVNCNYGGTSSVMFESANAGNMSSGSNDVPYLFILSGSPLSAGVSLSSPYTWNSFPAVTNADQTRGMSVQLDVAATVAGNYSDTITVTVAPN